MRPETYVHILLRYKPLALAPPLFYLQACSDVMLKVRSDVLVLRAARYPSTFIRSLTTSRNTMLMS